MLSFPETGSLSLRILHWTMTSPIFKGLGFVGLGAVGLTFGWRAHQKGEKMEFGFSLYLILAAFILLYGLFLLVLRPHWWTPPVWPTL